MEDTDPREAHWKGYRIQTAGDRIIDVLFDRGGTIGSLEIQGVWQSAAQRLASYMLGTPDEPISVANNAPYRGVYTAALEALHMLEAYGMVSIERDRPNDGIARANLILRVSLL